MMDADEGDDEVNNGIGGRDSRGRAGSGINDAATTARIVIFNTDIAPLAVALGTRRIIMTMTIYGIIIHIIQIHIHVHIRIRIGILRYLYLLLYLNLNLGRKCRCLGNSSSVICCYC